MKMGWLAAQFGKHLAKPGRGVFGLAVKNYFIKKNAYLELNAVRLCNIQPHGQVLEVGFGPGIGLEEAYEKVKDGSGIVHGVDLSDEMVKMATKRLQTQISDGKIQIKTGTVTQLPYPTHTFDRIFHVNCYYFWKDMDAAIQELDRVLKPGSLIVATFNPKALIKLKTGDYFKNVVADTNPERYMQALERTGFTSVILTNQFDEARKKEFASIMATSKASL